MAARPTGTTVRELLAASPAAHRRSVAAALGAGDASAAALARALRDDLADVVAALAPQARAAATALAFASPVYAGPRAAVLVELERHGLAFAFGDRWSRRYVVPADLEAPLREVRAAAHAGPVAAAGEPAAQRWVAAPAQTAHDAAALWAFLAQAPARVKADGELYARAWPKLIEALPPIDGLDAAGFGAMRVEMALELLRTSGFLRLRVGDRPGQEARRELAADGDLPGALERDAATLPARLLREAERPPGHAIAGALVRALGGGAALGPLGAALGRMLDEAGVHAYRSHDDVTRALSALGPLWLAGALELGADERGEPVAARLAPAETPPVEGPLGVCQSSFDVVCLRPPAPAERAALALTSDPVAGQAHVFRITRASARCAERSLGAGGARAALERLAGALPQNVERSIADWVRDVRPPLRLRSAIFVDAGDAASAEALVAGPLAGLVVERLGESLLAVAGRGLAEVERALAGAGHELEPGLDRVSGSWLERPDVSADARDRWSAGQPSDPPLSRAPGKLVSTLAERPAGAVDLTPEADSLTVILEALEEEADVEILYAGRRGITLRRITPLEIDNAALHAWCHLRDDERSFWLGSIQGATLIQD